MLPGCKTLYHASGINNHASVKNGLIVGALLQKNCLANRSKLLSHQKQKIMKRIVLILTIIAAGYATAYAQSSISGKVTDSKDGAPLAGVSVSVKGSKIATQTNAQGDYILAGVRSTATLEFTLIGYKRVELGLSPGNSTYNIALAEEPKQLNEVIITANAIKREAKSLGYATTTISNNELTKGKDRSVLNSRYREARAVWAVQPVLFSGAALPLPATTRPYWWLTVFPSTIRR
jgi:CarboxypepD_reg-like domain